MGLTKIRKLWVMRSWVERAKWVEIRKLRYFKWWVTSNKNWVRSDGWWKNKKTNNPLLLQKKCIEFSMLISMNREKMYRNFNANLHESISKNKIVKNLIPSIRNTNKTPMAAVHCGWPTQSIDERMSIFT